MTFSIRSLFFVIVACLAPLAQAADLDCTNAVLLNCPVDSATGVLGTGAGNASTYCGSHSNYSNAENVFTFTIASTQQVVIRVTNMSVGVADLFLLNACDEFNCIGFSINSGSTDEEITDCLSPGTYFIVVDSQAVPVMTYDLFLTCDECVPVGLEETRWEAVKYLYR